MSARNNKSYNTPRSNPNTQRSQPSLNQDQDLKKFQNSSLPTLILSCFKDGIPTSFTIGDYNLLSLIIKALLNHNEDVELSAASAYFTAYYSMFFHAIILGIQEAHGIYGSRAFGAENFKRVNLVLRQSLLIGFCLYFSIGILPYFWMRNLLRIFGNRESLIEKACKMVAWSFPGMGLRLVNDCMKPFLQNQSQELLRDYGWAYEYYYNFLTQIKEDPKLQILN